MGKSFINGGCLITRGYPISIESLLILPLWHFAKNNFHGQLHDPDHVALPDFPMFPRSGNPKMHPVYGAGQLRIQLFAMRPVSEKNLGRAM